MDEIWGSSRKGQSHKIFLGSNKLNMAEFSVCFFLFFKQLPFMINVSVKFEKKIASMKFLASSIIIIKK
jgi:hypothetical protein